MSWFNVSEPGDFCTGILEHLVEQWHAGAVLLVRAWVLGTLGGVAPVVEFLLKFGNALAQIGGMGGCVHCAVVLVERD